MKKAKYLFILLLFGGLYQSCIPNVDFPGRIYGTVEDKATGEPLKSAWLELNPSGLRITTGDDGAFEFPELDPNDYTLFVSKVGYVEYKTNTIEVKPNQPVKVDIQLERLPPTLKVMDDNRKDVDTLDFGGADDDVARSFNIYNDGDATLEWQITKTAEWIKSISKTEGKLAAGASQSIVVVIDRSKLGSGENKTILHITSNSGSKQLTIMATGQIVTILNTLPVTYLNSTSVTLSGEILEDGNPKYTERGFVYSELSKPTIKDCIKKINLPITNNKQYSTTLDNLMTNRTYYARAYAVQKGNEVYSTNEVVFVPKNSLGKVETTDVTRYSASLVEFEGNIIEVGEPVYEECGFVYGTNSNPTIDNSKKAIAPYTGKTGIYSMQITDPDLDVLSYVRAYIINDGEPSYGKSLTFRANSELPRVDKPTVTEVSPENRQATFESYITNSGSPAYTEVGFVYNTSSNPTLEKGTKIVVNTNSGQGDYHITVSDLTVNTTYYVRAFITNAAGTYYSDETKFDLYPILPIIETLEVTNLSVSSAIFKGRITSLGNPAYTECGFVYGTMLSPTLDNGAEILNAGFIGTGTIEKKVTDLVFNQEYYVRIYARNADTVAYGESVLFYGRDPNWIYFEELDLMVTTYDYGVQADWYTAKQVCDNLNLSGYNDWYLPELGDIGLLYILRNKIGNFKESAYWSSTEVNSSQAYAVLVDNSYYWDGEGATLKLDKTTTYHTAARCIRRGR